MAGWLIGCLAAWMAGWLIGCLGGSLVVWLVVWLLACFAWLVHLCARARVRVCECV